MSASDHSRGRHRGVPQRTCPRSSLTTADGIGMPGGNAITQGTLHDRVLVSARPARESRRSGSRGTLAARLIVVRPADGRPRSASSIKRRDRHGRGLRGPLAPAGSPLYRTRSERFDELVLAAVAQLEPRWEAELSGVEFAVEEVPSSDLPPAGMAADEYDPVPLARLDPAWPETGDPDRPARPARIVLYRRPLLARAEGEEELSDLVLDVVIEEFARMLGVDPTLIDPDYDDD